MYHLLAIDPGAKGGLAVFDIVNSKVVYLAELNPRPHFLMVEVLNKFKVYHVVMEKVHGRGGNSAQSNFSFGKNIGYLKSVIELKGLKIEEVEPQLWQSHVGVKQLKKLNSNFDTKFAAYKLCCDIFPDLKMQFKTQRGRLRDGITDACLIGHYYMKVHFDKINGNP